MVVDTLVLNNVSYDITKDIYDEIGDLTDLETVNKTNLVSAINEANQHGGSSIGNYQLNELYLYGDESEIQSNWQNLSKAKMNFRYVFYNPMKNKQKNGWCKLSLQGNATLSYPKHNFNLQHYKDAGYTNKDKVDYMDLADDKHPKWTIKANYNDYSQARNVVSARLWGDVVHSRPDMPKALSDAPNHGAVDGHPCILYMNDVYYGLYMYNIPKADWMLGLDEDNPLHCAVSANDVTNQTKWLSTGLTGWELEIPDTWQTNEIDGVQTSVQSGFIALQTFVLNATDTEFYENLSNYLNVPSAIDYLIFSFCVCNNDSMNKNQFLETWDGGITWYFTAYDMDQTFGAGFNKQVISYNKDLFTTHPNHLFERLIDNFGAEIVARYAVLRGSVFTEKYVHDELQIFFNEIPSGEREKDLILYPEVHFQSISSLETMQTFARNRLDWCDDYFVKIDPDYVPCTGISLDKSTISFTSPNATNQLTATPSPSGASDKIRWSTSNPSVATVTNTGLVTSVAQGTATITVTCGEYSDTCDVSVTLVSRGEVDYTLDGMTGVSFTSGSQYNVDTGVLETASSDSYTAKFRLQNCLYYMSGGSYARLFAWDENGNYKGCTVPSVGTPFTFSARDDWYYAVCCNSSNTNVSLMPIDHSETIGDLTSISVSEVTGYNGSDYDFYGSWMTSQFANLITATSGELNFDAVDWIWSNHFIVLKTGTATNKKPYPVNGAISLYINGSGTNVGMDIYTKTYNSVSDMNTYLSSSPIEMIFNLP